MYYSTVIRVAAHFGDHCDKFYGFFHLEITAINFTASYVFGIIYLSLLTSRDKNILFYRIALIFDFVDLVLILGVDKLWELLQ